MIIHETDNLCVGCTSMGLSCQHCKYSRPSEYEVLVCDNCKNPVEDVGEYYYIVDGQELCVNCAFEHFWGQNNKTALNEALKYIDSDKELQVLFYLNRLCKSAIYKDLEKVSDMVIEIVRKECLAYPNMLYDDVKSFCGQGKEAKEEFLSFFYERAEV